jgi:asparagine synthase (glutamine-hydrolysing)
MPGLAGIISKTWPENNKRDLRLMIECMMHETFYHSGTYVNERLGIYTGWISHEGSFSDSMPIFNEKKDVVLLFSGENFVDKSVTNELKCRGHEFDSSDASYLIHLYEDEGDEFLKKLNGWFSGILMDLRKGKTVLFNDRYGMQRIYYYEGGNAFYFSSEAKSLLKIRKELREINMKSLGEFFSLSCVLEYRTFFKNIFCLPNGAAWTFNRCNHIKKDYYFKPIEWENQHILGKDTFYKKMRETFQIVLPRYFNAKQLIGMSLTGGLDTRMIMALLDQKPGELPCYTFGGMERDCFDVKIAKKVAHACHQSHYILQLDEEFLHDFQKHAQKTIYITDGCLDICFSHEVYLNRLARDIAPIRMTGNFGDEVLRGVNYYKASSPSESLFQPDFNKFVSEAERTFNDVRLEHSQSYNVFNLIPWFKTGSLFAGQSQVTMRTPYMDNDLVKLMYQAPTDVRTNKDMTLRLIYDSNTMLSQIITDRGVGCCLNFPLSLIAKIYYEVLFKAEYYYSSGMPHWLSKLDYMFRPLSFEKLFLGRHKIEYYRIWFRDEVSDFLRDTLLDKRSAIRSFVNMNLLEKMVNGHINGHSNYTNEINRILSAELIHRLLIENI